MELATSVFDDLGNVLVNDFMPPDSPGAYDNDYNQLIDCYNNGPENTPACHWMIPPGGDCNSEIVGLENEVILGDLNDDLSGHDAVDSAVRGCFGGGKAPGVVNTIDFITIASTGNATDFGDLTTLQYSCAGASDSHGGLG